MTTERRKFTRYKVPLRVELKQGRDGDRLFSGTTLNFSRSGVCIKIDDTTLPIEGAVDLRVKLPDKDVFISAAGDVVWSQCSERECLAGIRLVAMNQEAKFYILSYCHGL